MGEGRKVGEAHLTSSNLASSGRIQQRLGLLHLIGQFVFYSRPSLALILGARLHLFLCARPRVDRRFMGSLPIFKVRRRTQARYLASKSLRRRAFLYSTGVVLNFLLFQGLCSARPRSPFGVTPSAIQVPCTSLVKGAASLVFGRG